METHAQNAKGNPLEITRNEDAAVTTPNERNDAVDDSRCPCDSTASWAASLYKRNETQK